PECAIGPDTEGEIAGFTADNLDKGRCVAHGKGLIDRRRRGEAAVARLRRLDRDRAGRTGERDSAAADRGDTASGNDGIGHGQAATGGGGEGEWRVRGILVGEGGEGVRLHNVE